MTTRVLAIGLVLTLYAVMAIVGITWGLPTSRIDQHLFGDGPVWSGEKIARLCEASARFDDSRAADVDADPVQFDGREPVDLTATEADVAAIYRRYRLFSHQPDEMITMMALAGMRPRELHFDPKLYQYGGLFIYPVGALIGLGGVTGLIEVTSDLVYYLDHPNEFGKFYIAARVYVVLWGALGILLVYAVASRLGGFHAGVLAALLFTLMPVVVCMAHEAKPHLPGAVLMLAAVWWAMRYADSSRQRDWVGMCICCGAAFGMVLSSLPIFVLIPLAEWMRHANSTPGDSPPKQTADFSPRVPSNKDECLEVGHNRLLGGFAIAILVYLVTNPYVAINTISNREVLRSNLGNSTAMYEIGRVGEGLIRVAELTVEGATLPVTVLGIVGLACGIGRRRRDMLPLTVPAGLIFVQFILLGAGKPAEYGRFGVFPNTALAIATACLLMPFFVTPFRSRRRHNRQWKVIVHRVGTIITLAILVLITGYFGWGYLHNFYKDTGPDNTREQFSRLFGAGDCEPLSKPQWDQLSDRPDNNRPVVCVLADPAPYSLPPMNFARIKLLRYPSLEGYQANPQGLLIVPSDTNPQQDQPGFKPGYFATGQPPYSPISWANKPIAQRMAPELH